MNFPNSFFFLEGLEIWITELMRSEKSTTVASGPPVDANAEEGFKAGAVVGESAFGLPDGEVTRSTGLLLPVVGPQSDPAGEEGGGAFFFWAAVVEEDVVVVVIFRSRSVFVFIFLGKSALWRSSFLCSFFLLLMVGPFYFI